MSTNHPNTSVELLLPSNVTLEPNSKLAQSIKRLTEAALKAPAGPYVAKVNEDGTDIEAKRTDTQIALVEHDEYDDEAASVVNYLTASDPTTVLAIIAQLQSTIDALASARQKIAQLSAELPTSRPVDPHANCTLECGAYGTYCKCNDEGAHHER